MGRETTSIAEIAAPIKNAVVGGPFGSNLTSRDYTDAGVPVVRGSNLSAGRWISGAFAYVSEAKADSLSANCASAGDIVFTQRGTLGQVAIIPTGGPSRYLISQSQMKLTVDQQKADALYVYYVFLSHDMQQHIKVNSIQTGVPHINLGILRELQIPLPPLEEQRAIAATLGALDDKIESNRRAMATISDLIDASSENNGVDLPTVPLGDIATSIKESVNPSKLGDAIVDHFSLPAFDSGARPERVAAASIKSNKLRVPKSAILLSRLNPRFNRTWWASAETETSALASTEFLVLTSEDIQELAAVWLAVRDPFFREELPKRVTGTSGSHQRVRPDDALMIEVPDFRRAAPEVKLSTLGLLMRAESMRIESDRLTALRDSLLPELLSGRIRVPVSGVAE